MSDVDDLLVGELMKLPKKPSDRAAQADKKRYSELMSAAVARAFSEALRRKGLMGTLPRAGEDSRTRKGLPAKGKLEAMDNGDEEISEEAGS